jgi:hypothetical protein
MDLKIVNFVEPMNDGVKLAKRVLLIIMYKQLIDVLDVVNGQW